ncbi:MAG: CRTAC1 family protein [Isosphaeraceae bacterium]|nr:CRTAC1 family protein [Isosphaeraceae bacterium]
MRRRSGAGIGSIVAILIAASWLGCDDRSQPPLLPAPGALEVRAPDDPKMPIFGHGFIDESGYELAYGFTAPIADRASLDEIYAASEGRSARGMKAISTAIERIDASNLPPERKAEQRAIQQMLMGILAMYDAEFPEADRRFARAVEDNPAISRKLRRNIEVLRGVAWLRQGELDNCVACVGPSSCIFPLAPSAVHLEKRGSTRAIEFFERYLAEEPSDLGVVWLLNIARMTLGRSTETLRPEFRLPLDRPEPRVEVPRFENVAGRVGLDTRGPNMSGGNVFDDFDGDGRPDVFVISTDWTKSASMFINRGDGTFEDRGEQWGLSNQKMALNAAHADYDNDGRLDLLVLRGGWETPYRMSLLRNLGDRFEDVTVSSGLAEPIATQSAAWGDYDGDGRLDLYVVGEYRTEVFEPRNRGRLYHNEGGRFVDVAATAGVENERWGKGASWGDYDGDGDIDLYVSNMNAPNRLYRNEGGGRFVDVAPELGVTEPERGFACWFWDYDNDGRLDLFAAGFGAWIDDVVADMLGRPTSADRPKLYRNLGGGRFADVTRQAGLDRVLLPMGCNFADIDNDGDLDIYLGTGRPPYSHLVPNVMLMNIDGERFEDVTRASGTGHLQKGHGVSFADWDDDGDVDLFVEAGGTTPGDRAHDLLFQNLGRTGRSLQIRLVGVASNRSAIGARIEVEVEDSAGKSRTIHRRVDGGSSFGGNSLTATIGLGRAERARRVVIGWPAGGTARISRDFEPGYRYVITEGSDEVQMVALRPIAPPPADEAGAAVSDASEDASKRPR